MKTGKPGQTNWWEVMKIDYELIKDGRPVLPLTLEKRINYAKEVDKLLSTNTGKYMQELILDIYNTVTDRKAPNNKKQYHTVEIDDIKDRLTKLR